MSMPRRFSFDGDFDAFVLRLTDRVADQIEASAVSAEEVHSGIDRGRALELMSDLLGAPSAERLGTSFKVRPS